MAFPERARAVVTGAGSGLGRAFAMELAGRRARLLLADVNAEALAETKSLVERRGAARVETQLADVTDAAQVEGLAIQGEELWGGTDLLVNNAGVGVDGPVGEVPLEDWRWVIDVNLWGVIYGCHSFVPRMKQAGGGYIINVASAAGLLCPPTMAPYNVTKAGVVALSETLSAELESDGIRVTALCPSFFKTNITNHGRLTASDEKAAAFVERQMSRTPVQAPEVARVALAAVERGQLYALPHRDVRGFWGIKRVAPSRFYKLVGLVASRQRRRR